MCICKEVFFSSEVICIYACVNFYLPIMSNFLPKGENQIQTGLSLLVLGLMLVGQIREVSSSSKASTTVLSLISISGPSLPPILTNINFVVASPWSASLSMTQFQTPSSSNLKL